MDVERLGSAVDSSDRAFVYRPTCYSLEIAYEGRAVVRLEIGKVDRGDMYCIVERVEIEECGKGDWISVEMSTRQGRTGRGKRQIGFLRAIIVNSNQHYSDSVRLLSQIQQIDDTNHLIRESSVSCSRYCAISSAFPFVNSKTRQTISHVIFELRRIRVLWCRKVEYERLVERSGGWER